MNTTDMTNTVLGRKLQSGGFLARLSRLPIVNFFSAASASGAVGGDSAPPASAEPPPAAAPDSRANSGAAPQPEEPAGYISPHFIKGMKAGELLFAIAAAYAYAGKRGIACRIPWEFNMNTRALCRLLSRVRLPGTKDGLNEPCVYREPESARFKPIPEDISAGGLRGYFHSPRYFAEMQGRVRQLFSPLAADKKEPGSFGIHINVGEGLYGHCKFRVAMCYYLIRAAEYIPPSVRVLTVFSESPSLAVSLLSDIPDYNRFAFKVEHDKALNLLRRMTEMENLILSNDALSWWAAWLGRPSTVITPHYWVELNGNKLPDIPDSAWMRI